MGPPLLLVSDGRLRIWQCLWKKLVSSSTCHAKKQRATTFHGAKLRRSHGREQIEQHAAEPSMGHRGTESQEPKPRQKQYEWMLWGDFQQEVEQVDRENHQPQPK